MSRIRVFAILAIAAAGWPVGTAAQDEAIRGSWHAREYVLASGPTHDVRGQIHFTESDWLVLFFVMDGESAARGSAEGGRYTLTGEELTFEHLHNFSVGEPLAGLPGSALRLETRGADGPLEPARVRVEDDVLTLFFPSGNRMTFTRGSVP